MGFGAYEYTPKLKPHAGQLRILRSKARFRVVKAGRRFGKTKVGIHWLISMAAKFPGELVYYVAPTYKMAKEIAWQELFNQLDPEMIKAKNERELWVDLINDARICLKGSENPDHLRGRRLAALLMDEAAFQKHEVFSRVLRPMLADLRAPAMFISSPRPGWFTQLFDAANKEADKSKMEAFFFTIYDNPTITREEIESVKATTSDHIWRSEYMAEEVAYIGQVYLEFSKANIFDPSSEYLGHEAWPGVVGIDWGSDDPTGVAFSHFAPSGIVVVGAEHIRAGWDSEKHCEVIRRQARNRNIENGNYVISHDAFRKTAKDHSSIAEDFRDHLGFMPQRSEKDLDSGVDLLKRLLRGDGENPWLKISSNCRGLITAFQNWDWDEHEPDVLSGLRYAIMHGVKRGMTTLARLNKVQRHASAPVPAGTSVLPVKKSSGSRWRIDPDFGVPLYA